MTNSDMLKVLDVKQMAKLLQKHNFYPDCASFPESRCDEPNGCYRCCLDWLNREVEIDVSPIDVETEE